MTEIFVKKKSMENISVCCKGNICFTHSEYIRIEYGFQIQMQTDIKVFVEDGILENEKYVKFIKMNKTLNYIYNTKLYYLHN